MPPERSTRSRRDGSRRHRSRSKGELSYHSHFLRIILPPPPPTKMSGMLDYLKPKKNLKQVFTLDVVKTVSWYFSVHFMVKPDLANYFGSEYATLLMAAENSE